MLLESLRVEGYRSLTSARIDVGAITVLTGPNGSGKTNVYRALRLAHRAATGELARTVAAEGGMTSIGFAGRTRGEPKVVIAVGLDGVVYELELVTASRGAPDGAAYAFPLDPVIRSERILLPVAGRRTPVALLDRTGTAAFVRDDDGAQEKVATTFHPSESVLTQLRDAHRYPELDRVRAILASMRFHDQLRTDERAPVRRASLGTRTTAVADDGADLAAALRTILVDGERDRLAHAVETSLDATLEIDELADGRLEVSLRIRPFRRSLAAAELSDGQLRFLFLAAALLAPRPATVVVLNEPEASLHGDLLPGVAELIASASELTQIVVTTHSEQLAHELERAGAVSWQLERSMGSTDVSRA